MPVFVSFECLPLINNLFIIGQFKCWKDCCLNVVLFRTNGPSDSVKVTLMECNDKDRIKYICLFLIME